MKAVLLFLFLALQSQAATYYVDYVGGNNANAGTSTGAPWKHHPWDTNRTGSAAITLAAGDVVILKGGVEYELLGTNNVLLATSSGTLSSRIVLDGDSGVYASRWGSGTNRAIIDGNFVASRHVNITSHGSITLNFLDLYAGGYGGNIVQFSSATNCTANEVLARERYDWNMASTSNKTGAYMLGIGGGIECSGRSKNIIIERCEITKVGGGGTGAGDNCTDITIRSNYVHSYIVWSVSFATDSSGEGLTNVYFHNNIIANMYHYTGGYWSGALASELVNSSTNENPHQDGIFIRQQVAANTDGAIQNLQIFNNHFYNDLTTNATLATAWIFTSYIKTNGSIFLYNNVFNKPYATPSVSLGWNLFNDWTLKIYHNTFIGMNDLSVGVAITNPTFQVIARNNLFGGDTGWQTDSSYDATCADMWLALNSDYNFYDTGADTVAYGPCLYNATLATWRTTTGEDANSISGSSAWVNPQNWASSSSADWSLSASSAAKNIFPVLSTNTYPGADRDIVGNLRAATTSAGAYEYQATATTYRGFQFGVGVQLIGPGRLTQ